MTCFLTRKRHLRLTMSKQSVMKLFFFQWKVVWLFKTSRDKPLFQSNFFVSNTWKIGTFSFGILLLLFVGLQWTQREVPTLSVRRHWSSSTFSQELARPHADCIPAAVKERPAYARHRKCFQRGLDYLNLCFLQNDSWKFKQNQFPKDTKERDFVRQTGSKAMKKRKSSHFVDEVTNQTAFLKVF